MAGRYLITGVEIQLLKTGTYKARADEILHEIEEKRHLFESENHVDDDAEMIQLAMRTMINNDKAQKKKDKRQA